LPYKETDTSSVASSCRLCGLVLPHVDQRVLLGELRERDMQSSVVVRVDRVDDDSSVGGGNSFAVVPVPATLIRSPMWISRRPQTFAIAPAETGCRCSAGPTRRGR
jgi:hypothetical protein